MGRRSRKKRRLGKKLALLFGALVLAVVLAELATRAMFPYPPPIRADAGYFVSTLPLLHRSYGGEPPPIGPPLAPAKRPGALRVAVFGESSVEGLPWGTRGSPVAMLASQLRAAFPQKDFDVINMGRAASGTIDAYYHLLALRPWAPDAVVFYQGTNDVHRVGRISGEWCEIVQASGRHGAWRWLVSHSLLAWNLHVMAPHVFGPPSSSDAPPEGAVACDDEEAFAAWADLLVATATELGATVIVALPASSVLEDLENDAAVAPLGDESTAGRDFAAGASEGYRALVRCVLTKGCDKGAALRGHLQATRPDDAPHFAPRALAPRCAAWKRAAERYGARVVDPRPRLLRLSGSGLLGPPAILDEVHLDLAGYWALARVWLEGLAAGWDEALPAAAEDPAADPAFQAFVAHFTRDSPPRVLEDQLLYLARVGLQHGRYVVATHLLTLTDERYDSQRARLVVGWLRHWDGRPTGLPPLLDDLVRRPDFDVFAQMQTTDPDHGKPKEDPSDEDAFSLFD